MIVPVKDMAGAEVGTVELSPTIFEADVNRGLMHQALVRQLANARLGTHKAKGRGEVDRTTAKWYRQKGTGRARHGSRRAPIFVGGGVAHGPKPRDYTKKMPRKMRRAALRSALTVKALNGDIVVLRELSLQRPKTRDMAAALKVLVGDKSALLLMPQADATVEAAASNLSDAKTLRADYLNIRDLLGYDKILLPLASLDVIESFLFVDDAFDLDEEE